MCGICGIAELGAPPRRSVVERMSDALAHRGPDGCGLFADDVGIALGFRRLAIIDLSERGNQPFGSVDGQLQLVHNGEIYNFRELRTELESHGHRFRSATDTEVVLAAYTEWGPACVERFTGMWAFAIWDARRGELFCSRDRFGIKPFYYRLNGDRFTFASELKAFACDEEQRLTPNLAAVRDFIEQGWVDHTHETFFAGIHALPPAHSLVFGRDGLKLERYWRLETQPRADDVSDDAVRGALEDSITLHLRSDVRIGTCLSGGIDSSAITCVVDRLLQRGADDTDMLGDRQQTFTAYFADAGFDERPYAEAVVASTRTTPHWITFDDDGLVAALPSIVRTQDAPFGSTSIVAQWFVMRAAREAGVTVMLDGQGADEIFAGYHGYFGPFLADLLRKRRLSALYTEAAAYRSLHGGNPVVALARPLLPDHVRRAARARLTGGGALVHPRLAHVGRANGVSDSSTRSLLRRQMHLILGRRGLPELLRYEDRNSMAHSLEARVPFLDHRLVELMFSLEPERLIERGVTKVALRRALADVLPPTVRDRIDKLGFVTPEARWLNGRLGELAADVFASASFADRGFVDAAAARKRLAAHRRGDLVAGNELWRALNVELWARTFLDGQNPTP